MNTAVLMKRQEDDTARAAAQRILSLKTDADESDAAFARRIGVASQHVVNWRAGGGADLKTIATVHRETGAGLHWLVTGEDDAYGAGVRAALEELGKARARITGLLGSPSAEDASGKVRSVRKARGDTPRRKRASGDRGDPRP